METQAFYIVGLIILCIVGLSLLIILLRLVLNLIHHHQFQRLERQKLKRELDILALKHEYQQSYEAHSWNGFRKFTVVDKVEEAENIHSFYLKPHDGKPFSQAKPGQYLTFRFQIAGESKPVIRCYSLSDTTHESDCYRITVKDLPGLSSSYLSQQIKVGDFLDVKAPSGHFCLDPERYDPVVLIGGGIGVTPVFSMLRYICKTHAEREVWFFYGLPYGRECVFKNELAQIKQQFPEMKIITVYSRPEESDQMGVDFDYKGHVSVALFKELLPNSDYEFYVCGPPRLMQQMSQDLLDWGVAERQIHMEAFGPSSVQQGEQGLGNATGSANQPVQVTFSKSNKTVAWSGEQSLLELAEANDIVIDYGCRAGSCGSCVVALREGMIDYPLRPDFDCEAGSCLACMAKPKQDIVVDA